MLFTVFPYNGPLKYSHFSLNLWHFNNVRIMDFTVHLNITDSISIIHLIHINNFSLRYISKEIKDDFEKYNRQ